jgi:hypothetical protein
MGQVRQKSSIPAPSSLASTSVEVAGLMARGLYHSGAAAAAFGSAGLRVLARPRLLVAVAGVVGLVLLLGSLIGYLWLEAEPADRRTRVF